MRRLGWLLLAGVAGCLLQTQDVPGLKGDKGDKGDPADSGNADTIDGLKGSSFMRADVDTGTVGSVFVGASGNFIVQKDGSVGIKNGIPTAPLTIGQVEYGVGAAIFQGDVQIANNAGIESSGGIEFKSGSDSGGWGWRLIAPNLTSSNTPFIVQSRAAAADWAERLRISNKGNVGIGANVFGGGSDPQAALQVSSSTANPCVLFESTSGPGPFRFHMVGNGYGNATAGVVVAADRVATANYAFLQGVSDYDGDEGGSTTQFRIYGDGSAGFKGTVSQNSPMPDIAENITAADPLIGPGDVVASDPSGGERIVLAAGPYARTLLGVISTHPGILLNGDPADLETKLPHDPRQRALALAGRVPVKVTLEGGPIRPGDPLTSSSIPGRAMRASEPWRGGVLGTALTLFDGKDESGKAAAEGKVIAFLSLDRTPTCDPEAQARLASKVGELEGKLASERDARLALEARLQALEAAMARPAEAQRRGR